ncbi:hypothetical protein I551_1840 [Mycobacterium ulcerans str. Harvey]|uniref:Uncharacterized protein n=1 Tax=Mycobacterium ulcerans str. Harvey TaxID=1299332 RepID=A0ABN0R3M6_MYCUL|nr:hypothetical protein I551_1840 [Mycobacterium ulcerans str. Harvey]
MAQASRLMPNLATVLGWSHCDHTGPVREGDTLYSELHVESAEPTANGACLACVRWCTPSATRSPTARCWTGGSPHSSTS